MHRDGIVPVSSASSFQLRLTACSSYCLRKLDRKLAVFKFEPATGRVTSYSRPEFAVPPGGQRRGGGSALRPVAAHPNACSATWLTVWPSPPRLPESESEAEESNDALFTNGGGGGSALGSGA
jgi:hypothetical protein